MTVETAARRAEAVERLYEVFGLVRRPARVEGCPHCVAPDEDRPLLDRPVRSLQPEDLARYAAKALSTWGAVGEFRYFVPRLLECAAHDAFIYPDPPIVFGKLAVAGWADWPEEERTAVGAFFTAWWADALDRYPSRPDIGTTLCCLGATGVDLRAFLDAWGRLSTVAAIRHLHEFVVNHVRFTSPTRLTDAFWDVRSTGHGQVIAWLTGGRAATAVETAFDAESREDVLRLLDEVYPSLAPAEDHTEASETDRGH
jgi:hypothetical protein